MPKGHAPKREAKKPKQKPATQTAVPPPVFTSSEVEVVKKRRKTKETEE